MLALLMYNVHCEKCYLPSEIHICQSTDDSVVNNNEIAITCKWLESRGLHPNYHHILDTAARNVDGVEHPLLSL